MGPRLHEELASAGCPYLGGHIRLMTLELSFCMIVGEPGIVRFLELLGYLQVDPPQIPKL